MMLRTTHSFKAGMMTHRLGHTGAAVERGSTRAAATRPECIRVMEPYIEEASIQPNEQWRSRLEIGGINEHVRRDRIPAGLLDQLLCNKHGCTFRVHPQQTPGSQLGYDVADLLEHTTPDAAEWDGNNTELAGCGFTVTDDDATGESVVVAYFTCNTPVEYRGLVLNPPRAPVTVSSAGPTTLLTSDTGVAGSLLLDEVPSEYSRVIDEVLEPSQMKGRGSSAQMR
eukprot:jgi/Tetstr1/446438/TSEL_033980.t1